MKSVRARPAIIAYLLLFVLWPVGLPTLAHAELTELTRDIQSELAASSVPGAMLVIVENGTTVYAEHYGVADIASATPMGREHRIAVGSISKNLTSLALMKAEAEGLLSLDDALARWLPQSNPANPWADSSPIRLRHLLQHTAGIEGSTFEE